MLAKAISLGAKAGINEALMHVASREILQISKLDEFEETQLLLIADGTNVKATGINGEWNTPLTSAILSIQAERVKFLIEQGAVIGDLDFTLKWVEHRINNLDYAPRNAEFRIHHSHSDLLQNLVDIKQLLVDKGLLSQ